MNKLFKKLTISQTIIFLSTLLFSLQGIYGLIINTNLNMIGHHITQIETQYIPLTKKITLLSEYQLKQEIEFERAYRYALEINKANNADTHFIETKSAFQQLSNKIDKEITLTLNGLAHDISITDSERSKEQFQSLTQRVDGFKSRHKIWETEVNHVFDLFEKNAFTEVYEQSEQIEKHAIELESDAMSILSEIETYTENSVHELREEDHNALLTGIILVSISLLMAIIFTRLVIANLKEDLNELKSTITNISEGNLLTEVSSKLGKEFGLDTMRKHLQSTMLLVQSGANEILGASYGQC